MKPDSIVLVALLTGFAAIAEARAQEQKAPDAFDKASADFQQQVRQSLQQLVDLQARIADEKVPLTRQVNELETRLSAVRQEYQDATRLLDTRELDLNNLRFQNKGKQEDIAYLSTLFGEYIRTFESKLHIVELQRHEDLLQRTRLAMDNSSLSKQEVFTAQAELVEASVERLHEALGGVRFAGTAIDVDGLQKKGTFALVGPAAIFRSDDGAAVGTAEQRLGSLEPAIIRFEDPETAAAATDLVAKGEGAFPLDPTLGNAHKIAATQETLLEHIQKGGPVMYPILVMAGIALLLVIYKWLAMAFLRRPSKKQIAGLLDAVGKGQYALAREKGAQLPGPVGGMLAVGTEHLGEPRELIEEVMYENLLTTKLRLNSLLPFIAICAASAPLLGLLGTVTGIINTFKLITVFGSGDVKMLSGGISEALITTEFGLIVAIPSLLLHSFLSRKARGIVGEMEAAGIALMNQITKVPSALRPAPVAVNGVVAPDPSLVRAQVQEIVREMLGPLAHDELGGDVQHQKA